MMMQLTERYLDLAQQGRNAWWRYALGAFTIAFFWLVLGYVPYLLLVGAGLSDQLLEYLAVNFSIFMMLAGLVLTVKLIHRRPLLSLVTPEARVDWRRMGRGALVWMVIAAVNRGDRAPAVSRPLLPELRPWALSSLSRGGAGADADPDYAPRNWCSGATPCRGWGSSRAGRR